jgi:MFS family permease
MRATQGMQDKSTPSKFGIHRALILLLAINLFNYIDRQILAAVEPEVRKQFFLPDDPSALEKMGWLSTAFLASYMIMAPIFGMLADRLSRWLIVGCSVALWSLASGWSGLASSFAVLLTTRMMVGIGEAGYGPAAPTIISDIYPEERRGRMMSYFYMAIPVGSALGYVFGGQVGAHYGWRMPFYLVTIPGLLLATLCFFMRDPRGVRARTELTHEKPKIKMADVAALFRIPSYVLNTGAMAAMTFAIGGMQWWIISYIVEFRVAEFPPDPQLLGNVTTKFGVIVVVAGLLATLFGGWLGDWLRKKVASAYFLVSGFGILISFPATVAMLYVPFPTAWYLIFIACFFLFFNTGPANAALANVTPPRIRATAFALNILVIHALGDALSPPLMGWIAGQARLADGRPNMNLAFLTVSAAMVLASAFWLIGAKYLPRDTKNASAKEEPVPA